MTIEVEVGNIVQVVDDRNLIVIDQGNTVEVAAVGAQGPTGPTGATGPQGPIGPAGPGVAQGGTTGQALVKASATDYDTAWSSIWENDQVVIAGQVFG